ncbi:MAG: nucleoside-diphosphate kinase [Nanoarchaeota archaeon]|nr:nucleoside-diphosphate kinase [Nanoarchaeota archaeon]
MIEKTVILIKPDGVVRSLVGEILHRFEKTGMKIIGLKMVWIDKDFAKEHYKAHKDKAFFKELVEFITEGPVVAVALEGVHAIHNVRKIVGATDPRDAAPGTIRGDFAHLSMEWASKQKSGGKNIIHASACKKDADEELKLWFEKKELHGYKTVHEKHTF